jgi:multicomponent Na+:H+ antiporter subunit E
VEYRTYLPGDLPRTVFSDSITLTPGTVTVELEEDLLHVHCLCPYHAEGLAGLEKMVAWLFGVSKDG